MKGIEKILGIGLIAVGVISRFFMPIPNFTPTIAIALFAGVYLPKRLAIIVPLAMFVIADMFIALHALVLFTWGSIALVALIGQYYKKRKSAGNIAMAGFGSACLFYIITNFGVWLVYPTYPHTAAGLVQCYVAAIPYFQSTLVSTAIYGATLFGLYELILMRVKAKQPARA